MSIYKITFIFLSGLIFTNGCYASQLFVCPFNTAEESLFKRQRLFAPEGYEDPHEADLYDYMESMDLSDDPEEVDDEDIHDADVPMPDALSLSLLEPAWLFSALLPTDMIPAEMHWRSWRYPH